MRERPCFSMRLSNSRWITPACAGKTFEFRGRPREWRDHPRVCGKDSSAPSTHAPMTGSPPRVRERQTAWAYARRRRRITPACAGKTDCTDNPICWAWDHPRVCGKDLYLACYNEDIQGSPPRVRERPQFFQGFSVLFGITPACAGKTKGRLAVW